MNEYTVAIDQEIVYYICNGDVCEDVYCRITVGNIFIQIVKDFSTKHFLKTNVWEYADEAKYTMNKCPEVVTHIKAPVLRTLICK